MVPWLRGLLCKPGDLGLDLQYSRKSMDVVMNLESQDWENRVKGIPETAWPASFISVGCQVH